ncbi:Ribosome 60S biogenesis N-terminal, putative [Leishmania donovani]|uniref:Ribosome 60S biogenesis N-terminal, putative n=1 Tax=Leishmania donovani TaxID=5661 RepID=A0A3S7WYA4_LEIDO|nr:Ribosome 60S biogenesis N-terminal, putative [Leishmania donovani]
MALVEPLVGHLLSKYKETVLEGLSKIRHTLQVGDEQANELAVAVSQREEALQALRATLLRHEYFVPTLQTLTVVLTQLVERGNRVALAREVLRGDCAALFRKTLATLSDATLTHVTAALQFLTVAVKDAPLLVLARLRTPADAHAAPAAASTASMSPLAAVATQRRADVPLHLAVFRLQLTYNQRRIRLTRLGFLVQLVTSPMHNAVVDTICSHGVLTHLLEDAAELLREGTSAGMACALSALRVVRELFVQSRHITAEQKRRVLLAQRNVFRLLVRALEFDHVADNAAAILYAIVDETIESPADYASTRVESLEDQGMPNYLLFFLLRQLRPKASERMSQLVLHILQRAPDLIRPYFIRVSGHLAEEGSSHGVAPATARVAVLNLMTRTFLCPMPYHLAAQQVRLEPVVAKTSTFYTMCPRDVADEICPAWVAEYVHRLINGSTNLLMLALAMQLTQAALMRAKRVLPLVLAVQNAAKRNKRASTAGDVAASGSAAEMVVSLPSPCDFTEADLDVLQGNDTAEAEVWDTYNAQVRHHLQAALPSREEFWHRMTQQLHRTLAASAAAPTSSTTSPSSAATDAVLEKTHLVVQRMLLLMKNYVEVFDVRVPWLSAVPLFLPDLAGSTVSSSSVTRGPMTANGSNGHATAAAAPVHPITAALQKQNDILKPWPAASVALLCELLAVSQQRRVPMMKMHHINMSQAVGIGEWPLLLSILLWVTHHRPHSPPRQESMEAVQEARAMGWAAQLLLWTVHSVTIHSTCTMAEAHLWLSCLTPNTVPVFLHVLNHLLMRSLSKVADRVSHELRDAQHGVLATAALHFIDRTKEKQQQKCSTGGGEDEGDGEQHDHQQLQRKQKTPRVECANNNGGGSSSTSSANMWGTHLQASLAEFESVVARVVHLWGRRARLLAQAAVATTAELDVPRVTQQECIEVLILADRQRGFAKAPRHYRSTSQSVHLRTFAFTLHSPALPLPEEDAAVALLSRLSIAVSSASPLDGEEQGGAAKQAPMSTSLVEDVCTALGIEGSLAAKSKAAKVSTPPWFVMGSVCWQVAGVLLSLTHSTASAPSSCSSSTTEAAHKLALRLARALLSDEAALTAHLRANVDHEGSLTGLLVLMLACTRTLLQLISLCRAEQQHPCLSVDECAALGRVCLDVYSGTLGVQDRLIYAVCLTLHYLSAARHVAHPAAAIAATMEERGDEAAAEQQGKRQRSVVAKYLSSDCHEGAEVPDALVQRRFLLCGHTASATRTPEVEMLSWHLDTLTEEEMTCMALHASSRLHNSIHLQDGSSADGATDLLGAVFPELRSAGDAHVADLERLSLGNVLDLRYMVPLLHRVASIPAAFSAHLPTGRVIPLLLKALTSIDSQLRSAAAAALSALYIPKGALRVVVSVARIKLAHTQMPPSTGGAGRRSQQPTQPRRASSPAAVPRLPTPLAIMLIMSIRPLGRYDDVLHHHLVHFLMHLESVLGTPMPFTHWAITPPLAAISVPLMLERQEALQLRTNKLGGGGKSSGGVTQASAADVAHELRKEIPPQLAFLLQLLRHACEVPQDGVALIESNGLDGLLLLCDMLTASDGQRASYVQCLLVLCTQSAALTRLFARAGHVLAWTVSFLWQLCREYGKATPYPYSGQTFTTALELLRIMCAATVQSKTSLAEAPALSDAAAEQLKESMRQLRAWVVDAHVTARDVLDVFDDMIGRCSHAAHGQHSGAAEADDTHSTEGVGKAQEARAVSPASASQPSSPSSSAKRRRATASRCERHTPPKRMRTEGTAEVGGV